MSLCPRCGRANSDEARFCSSCGATLTQAPPVKVEVKSPLAGFSIPKVPGSMSPSPSGPIPRQIQRIGTCFYHVELPASYVCSRCGRSICVSCSRQYGLLSFCPECYWGLAPRINQPTEPYPYQQQYQQYQPDAGRMFF